MNPSNTCRHNVPPQMPCPWCGREAVQKTTLLQTIKKPFQLYQSLFQNFVQEIAPRVQAPMCVAVIVEDINGEVFISMEGPVERLRVLNAELNKRLEHEIKQAGLNA